MGQRLRGLLAERKMSQADLARAAGLTCSAISRYALGERVHRAETLLAIARALGTSVDYLLGNSAEPFAATAEGEAAQIRELALRSRARMTAGQKCDIIEALVCGKRRAGTEARSRPQSSLDRARNRDAIPPAIEMQFRAESRLAPEGEAGQEGMMR